MLFLVLAMAAILVLAIGVVLYAAYPHRGEDLPVVPWLGDALRKGVEVIPTLNQEYADRSPGAHRR